MKDIITITEKTELDLDGEIINTSYTMVKLASILETHTEYE